MENLENRTVPYRVRIEKRRGFQPPYYTVAVYECGCGAETTMRRNWHGPAPRGAVACRCGQSLTIV